MRYTVTDFHSHYVDPQLVPEPPPGTSRGLARLWPDLTDWNAQLASLGAGGVDRRVVSAPVSTLAGGRGAVPLDLIKAVNESLASRVSQTPDRISAMATVDVFAGEPAAAEASRAVKGLGLRALCVDCGRDERLLDAPEARPVLEAAAELGVPVFVHPVTPPAADARYEALEGPGRLLARGSESALSLLAILRAGVLEELPALRLVVPMIAVSGLYYARLPDGDREAPNLAGRLYLDTMGLDAAWVRLALELVGPLQVVVGTDYPIVNEDGSRAIIEDLLRDAGLVGLEARAVASATAARLLGEPG